MNKINKKNILIFFSIIFLLSLGLLVFKEYRNSHENENTLKVSKIEKVLASSDSSASKIKNIQKIIKDLFSYFKYMIYLCYLFIFISNLFQT